MCCGEQEPGDEREVVNEESKLGLVPCPMRWPMESEGKKQDIGGRKQSAFGKEGSGEKTGNDEELEYHGEPGENVRDRESR